MNRFNPYWDKFLLELGNFTSKNLPDQAIWVQKCKATVKTSENNRTQQQCNENIYLEGAKRTSARSYGKCHARTIRCWRTKGKT